MDCCSCHAPLRTWEILLDDHKQSPLIVRGHELEVRPATNLSDIRVIIREGQDRHIAYWSPHWRVRAIRDITGQEATG